MNISVVSTFDGNTDDYMEMFNATKEKTKDFMADYHLGIIRGGKSNVNDANNRYGKNARSNDL